MKRVRLYESFIKEAYKFYDLFFNSHLDHNPECDILEGHLDKDSLITYGIYVKGPKQGLEFMEYYSGSNYKPTSDKRSSSRLFMVDKIPAKYKAMWEDLKKIYEDEYAGSGRVSTRNESLVTEGQFSWMTQDTGNQIGSEKENTIAVTMFDDKGNKWLERKYDGYGEFGGKDYYELLAQMNGVENADRQDGIDIAFGKMKIKGDVLFPALIENPARFNFKKHDFTQEPENDPNQSWYQEPEYDDDDDDNYDDSNESKVTEGATINVPKLSDIDHTRIIKWMSNQFDSNTWDIKKSGKGFEITIDKLSKAEQEDLMAYLKSQDYISESKVTEAKAKGLDWVIGELGDKPKCFDVASFVYDNYDKVTGLKKSMRNDEMDFPQEIMDVVDHYGLDIDEFTDCYGMAAESLNVNEKEVNLFDEVGPELEALRSKISGLMKKSEDDKWTSALGKALTALSTLDRNLSQADSKLGVVPVNEALSKEQKMVETFLNKVAKEFDYSIQDAARFVKETISKMGLDESKVNEASMSDIDLMAQEAKDFKSFVKEFTKEYHDLSNAGEPGQFKEWLQSVYDNAKANMDESVITEAIKPAGLSKAETKKVAETYAKAISKHDGCKCTVNTKSLEEDSFDLDIDGEEYAGGSYIITLDGDVVNAALPEKPVYGQIDSTVDQIIKNLKK